MSKKKKRFHQRDLAQNTLREVKKEFHSERNNQNEKTGSNNSAKQKKKRNWKFSGKPTTESKL